jgi:hypothetical protein
MNKDVLYIEKAKLIESILIDIDDITIVKKLRSMLNKNINRPASMTIEQLRKEVVQATTELEKGKGISHEEFMKEVDTWK